MIVMAASWDQNGNEFLKSRNKNDFVLTLYSMPELHVYVLGVEYGMFSLPVAYVVVIINRVTILGK